MKTQYAKILRHLEAGETLSVPQALLQFGQVSLAVAVFKLRKDGHKIKTQFAKSMTGKTYAIYSLDKEQQ